LNDSATAWKKPLKNPETNAEMNPLRRSTDNQVFQVYEIAKTGNSVFNDQIVNSGDIIIIANMKMTAKTTKKHPKQPLSESFFIFILLSL